MDNRTYFSHLKLFKSNILSKRTKKLYKTLIQPIVTYGAKAWTIKLADEQHLRVFERKVIRRIYGPVFIDGEWKRRFNKEMHELLGHENIQSHPNTTRGNRRLSLAALPGRPAASRGVKLPLLPNTRSIFQSL